MLDLSHIPGGSLLPHQRDALPRLMTQPHVLLSDPTGSGKTVLTAAYIAELGSKGALDGPGVRVLWLTEASLVGQTDHELSRLLPTLTVVSTLHPALAPKPSKKAEDFWSATIPPAGPQVLVTSYETAYSRLEGARGFLPAFEDHRPTLLVLDEVSAVKGGETTWRAARRLSGHADRVVGVTATLSENHPIELHNVLSVVRTPGIWDRRTFDREYVTWEPEYQLSNGTKIAAKPLGIQEHRMADVQSYVAQHTIRRRLETLGVSLPAVQVQHEWVSLSPAEQKAYDRVSGIEGLYGHHRRQQAGRAGVREQPPSLVLAAVRWLASRPDVAKVVIYAENLATLDALCERLDAEEIGHVRVDGKKAKADRTEAVQRFSDDPSVRCLVGSSVLERGLDGLQHCRVLLTLGPSDNPAREAQREGRLSRNGSPHSAILHVTFAADTPLERRRQERLDSKRALRDGILGAA